MFLPGYRGISKQIEKVSRVESFVYMDTEGRLSSVESRTIGFIYKGRKDLFVSSLAYPLEVS